MIPENKYWFFGQVMLKQPARSVKAAIGFPIMRNNKQGTRS
jgi:hypothetical protein